MSRTAQKFVMNRNKKKGTNNYDDTGITKNRE